MTLRSSHLQSDSDLDSIRNSCDVLWYNCLDFRTKTLWYTWHSFNGSTPYFVDFCSAFRHAFLKVCQRWQWKMFKMREGNSFLIQLVRTGTNREASLTMFPFCNLWAFSIYFAALKHIIYFGNIFWEIKGFKLEEDPLYSWPSEKTRILNEFFRKSLVCLVKFEIKAMRRCFWINFVGSTFIWYHYVWGFLEIPPIARE